MNIAKRSLILLCILILMCCAAMYAAIALYQPCHIQAGRAKSSGMSAFEGKLLIFNIAGIHQDDKIHLPKFLWFEQKAPLLISMIHAGQEDRILIVSNQNAKIYTQKGKKAGEFKPAGRSSKIASCCLSDLNNDGFDEILLLSGDKTERFAPTLSILSAQTDDEHSSKEGLNIIYTHTFKGLNPWKVQTCDVDGDGRKEISLGVYKTSRFHPVLAKRPFIYNWTGTQATPKWLGSRLTRPFDDYMFADINEDGRDELLSIEILRNGNRLINSYSWKGFGFEGIGQSREFADISKIHKANSVSREKVEICVHTGKDTNELSVILQFKKGSFLEK